MRPDRIWLLQYPVELGRATVEHVEEWMREFRLIAIAEESDAGQHHVPAQLLAMVAALRERYATELSEPDRLRDEAAARGEPSVDLWYPVRDETEQTVLGWQQMVTAVDSFCAAQALLTLQRSPEVVELQDWVVEQFLSQLRGEPPRPWSQRKAAAS